MLGYENKTDSSRDSRVGLWGYARAMVAIAATVAGSYFGWQLLSSLWGNAIVSDPDLHQDGDGTALPQFLAVNPVQTNDVDVPATLGNTHRNPAGRRLLAVSVANLIPNQQVEATEEWSYSLENVFSGNVQRMELNYTANNPQPTWLRIDPIVGTYDTVGNAAQVFVQNNIAYVADTGSGLTIIDASNKKLPFELAIFSDTAIQSVYALANNVYLASGAVGLQIVDVSNPATPALLGTYNTPSSANDVVVVGNIAYVADGLSGLQIVNVNNPASPVLMGSYDTPDQALAVSVVGSTAYVADRNSGLQIIDVTSPAAPVLLGLYDTLGQAQDVFIQASTAFVADAAQGLQILNVAAPATPILLGNYNTPGSALSVVVQGSTAYVADNTAGVQVIDVTSLAAPTLIAGYATGDLAYDVFLAGANVYVADFAAGLRIMDIGSPNLKGTPTASRVGEQYTVEVKAFDNVAASASTNVQLIVNRLPKRQQNDLSDQTMLPGNTLQFLFDSDILFSDPDNGFIRLDVRVDQLQTLPNFMAYIFKTTLLGSYDTPAGAFDAYLRGNHLFVADSTAGLQILDVQNTATPVLRSTFNTPDVAQGVFVIGNTAYVADGTSGLQIVDVTNAVSPALLGSYNTPGTARDIFAIGTIAYVADGSAGIQILDVSNPASPALLSTYNTPGEAYDVFVSANITYVADGTSGLQILDVTNPASPVFLANVNTPGTARGVFVDGASAYVADLASGMQVLDVSTPAAPILLSTYNTPSDSYGVFARYGTAYIADYSSGLQIVDVTNTTMPVSLGSYKTPSNAYSIRVQGMTAYIADFNFGPQIVDLSQWQLTVTPTIQDAGNYKITLTATDDLGATVADSFVLRVEGAPIFNSTIANQQLTVGVAYNYFIPQGVVRDPNNDPITFDARLISGNDLPPWLNFNVFSATFAGTPTTSGVYPISLSAKDNIVPATTTNFTLTVSFAPQVNQPISAPLPWREGKNFTYTFSENAFTDLNGNSLIYSAGLGNSLPLPSWLSFDSNTRTFSGNPPLSSATTLTVFVTASDAVTGASVSQDFALVVTPNLAPELENPVPAQRANVNQRFAYAIAANTFMDPNNDALTYTAGGMPKWLGFSQNTLVFSGKPGRGDTNTYANRVHGIQVIASDGERFASTTFSLVVAGASQWELLIKIGSPILAVLGAVATAYAARAIILNRCCRNKYEKLPQHVEIGTFGKRIPLDCDGEDVHSIVAKLTRSAPTSCLAKTSRFFCSARRANPNGKLPSWLVYHPEYNALEVVAPGPREADDSTWTIQAKNSAGVLLTKFELEVRPALNSGLGIEFDTGSLPAPPLTAARALPPRLVPPPRPAGLAPTPTPPPPLLQSSSSRQALLSMDDHDVQVVDNGVFDNEAGDDFDPVNKGAIPLRPVMPAPKPPMVASRPPMVAPKPPMVAPRPPMVAPKPPMVASRPPMVAPRPSLFATQSRLSHEAHDIQQARNPAFGVL